jgi:hypothetical protein
VRLTRKSNIELTLQSSLPGYDSLLALGKAELASNNKPARPETPKAELTPSPKEETAATPKSEVATP